MTDYQPSSSVVEAVDLILRLEDTDTAVFMLNVECSLFFFFFCASRGFWVGGFLSGYQHTDSCGYCRSWVMPFFLGVDFVTTYWRYLTGLAKVCCM